MRVSKDQVTCTHMNIKILCYWNWLNQYKAKA
jgi:hypothetical protein